MGANVSAGGFGCSGEGADFEPFIGSGGEVHALIVCLNYDYSEGNELTGIRDGKTFERLCRQAHVDDVMTMYDDCDKSDPSFPFKANVIRAITECGRKTKPEDFFIMFYAGHGENVPDHPPCDEDDGQDEAFVLPGPNNEVAEDKYYLIDDDFVAAVESSFNKECRIILVFDCCHSATLADIDSHAWKHRILSISACQDDEEATDTGRGGLLTIALEKTIKELAVSRGKKEYSIESLYTRCHKHAQSMTNEQELELQHANLDPKCTPWPLPHPWWSR